MVRHCHPFFTAPMIRVTHSFLILFKFKSYLSGNIQVVGTFLRNPISNHKSYRDSYMCDFPFRLVPIGILPWALMAVQKCHSISHACFCMTSTISFLILGAKPFLHLVGMLRAKCVDTAQIKMEILIGTKDCSDKR